MKTNHRQRSTRVYHDEAIADRQQITLTATASRHLLRVLRLRPGDALTVFDGLGGEYPARLLASESSRLATLALEGRRDRERESPLSLTLAQVVARGEKMDLIIQKAVELGVQHIIPLTSQRCNVHLDPRRAEKRHRHWQGIIIAACEQCGRNRLPRLAPVTTIDDWLAQPAQAATRLLLSPGAERTLGEWASGTPATDEIQLLIGPEGGLADEEIERCSRAGCRELRLGARILRTETAGLAALAALQALLGDFR